MSWMRSTPVYAEREEPGATIRQPSVALLCVDSEDKYDQARDAVFGTNSHTLRVADETPYNTLIYKNGPLMAGKISRIGLTEFNMNWSVPTITPYNNTFSFIPGFLGRYPGYGLTTNNGELNAPYSLFLTDGFYTMGGLAAGLVIDAIADAQLSLKYTASVSLDADTLAYTFSLIPKPAYIAVVAGPITVSPVTGGSVTINVGALKGFTAGNVVTVYATAFVDPKAPYFFGIVQSYVGPNLVLQNIQGIHNAPAWLNPLAAGITVELTSSPMIIQNELTNMMGFDGPNLISQTWLDRTDIPPNDGANVIIENLPPRQVVGDFARMTYTPYIDIVSARLTKNQSVYDNSSSLNNPIRSLLARIYLTPDGLVARDDPDLVLGCKPFTINKLYNIPKQIAWEPTENIDSVDLRILDWKGRVLYSLPTVTVFGGYTSPSIIEVGNTASYQMTLQVSEN